MQLLSHHILALISETHLTRGTAQSRSAFVCYDLDVASVQVLMDELVRPEAPITDYVTRYSGITAAMMAGVTTSLADVQVAHCGATKPWVLYL